MLGLIALVLLARRSDGNGEDAVDDEVLAATLLAEVAAIRDSALEQYEGIAPLVQDLPIPGSHHSLLRLPQATVFTANADRLDLLPGEFAARLVRFYAIHDGVAHLLSQVAHVRCDTLRSSLRRLIHSAEEALGAR